MSHTFPPPPRSPRVTFAPSTNISPPPRPSAADPYRVAATPRPEPRVRARSTKIRVRWGRIALMGAVGVTLGAMTYWGLSLLSEDVPPASVPWCTDAIADAGGTCHGEPLPECPTEDSADCYWDAAAHGNGLGRSFVDVDGVTYYQAVNK